MSEPDRLTAALTESGADLLAYFLRRVERDDAADLLGETMVIAWRRVGDLPVETEPARMWLFGVARGVLRNYTRGKRRQRALAYRLRDRLHQEVVPAADQGVDVRDAIEHLPPELAEIVQLVHWERLTLVDCSALLGIPASTARGRYQRARQQLRVLLEPQSSGTLARDDRRPTDNSTSSESLARQKGSAR
ncbi:MAG: sigma-70 family RNA polymerase sigma factor [Microbacterium sp.]|jgi:RNA polymerase sigma-70 factor (ECF subfamily)|uniref:RNA polymerase sigma factor n=1 Tax=Microbacterium sp. TaxID=51671 RepID=UPI002835D137|nr:sigma-70 family RNA polymerase sigma factor [Microbacterium sp.]MDR2322547.1 sigma-70 family RNA polymerase sigma factor [Microbacterium sp.]